MNFTRFGGRTFLIVIGCGMVTSVMKWFEHLDNPTYGMIIASTIGAYVVANAVETHGAQRADVQKTIAAAQSSSPPSIVEQVPK